ncbi:MAG TPA: aldolase/citrate lyase family protein, partial [Caldilineaceae bacterium]|nr:aldolase/citrate lyase family protein [Caldilineaceae bacterium]
MPARINKAIELLEQGQPVYYTGVRELSYESGRAAAKTWADYLSVDMEHGVFDLGALDAFMRGLVDGGPTASGHRTPAVIVTLPVDGVDEQTMRANAWMIKQVLARGVHGLLLCHVESPGAARAFVEAARYPFQTIGVGDGLEVGRRGSGGQGHAAAIWGVSVADYLERADVWPLNPAGELLLGLKIENRRALENAEATTRVPGLAFAEWGPGDMGMSFGYRDAHDPPYSPEMEAAMARVKAACDAAG